MADDGQAVRDTDGLGHNQFVTQSVRDTDGLGHSPARVELMHLGTVDCGIVATHMV
jgi:hypothetical protein